MVYSCVVCPCQEYAECRAEKSRADPSLWGGHWRSTAHWTECSGQEAAISPKGLPFSPLKDQVQTGERSPNQSFCSLARWCPPLIPRCHRFPSPSSSITPFNMDRQEKKKPLFIDQTHGHDGGVKWYFYVAALAPLC